LWKNEKKIGDVMINHPEFTLAAIQAAPVYFDREASTEKACQLIEEAAQKGANFVAFGETWLPGYPFFHRYPVLSPLWNQAVAAYLANGVEIPSPTTDRLCKAARRAGIDVAIGLVELDAWTRGTVYCTLLFIGREGDILGRHRKLKPTLAERMLWGEGDGVGLAVYERPYGRISGLSCGEHAMLLPAYALMAQGTQIHVAAWPFARHISESSSVRGLLMSRAFAAQGNCYVIAVASLLRPDDVPKLHRDLVRERGDGNGDGGSCIIAPGGEVIATAPAKEETILTASVSLEAVLQLKAVIDVGAHYSRPDVLQLHVNRRPLERIVDCARSNPSEPPADGSGAEASLGTGHSVD
jgi:predicted amidohydrolase